MEPQLTAGQSTCSSVTPLGDSESLCRLSPRFCPTRLFTLLILLSIFLLYLIIHSFEYNYMLCPLSLSNRLLSVRMVLGSPDTYLEEFQIIYVGTSPSRRRNITSWSLKLWPTLCDFLLKSEIKKAGGRVILLWRNLTNTTPQPGDQG